MGQSVLNIIRNLKDTMREKIRDFTTHTKKISKFLYDGKQQG